VLPCGARRRPGAEKQKGPDTFGSLSGPESLQNSHHLSQGQGVVSIQERKEAFSLAFLPSNFQTGFYKNINFIFVIYSN